jgi:hypothetical protein
MSEAPAMLVITLDEPKFIELVNLKVPRIAEMPKVRELMKKYTSGYLTAHRLAEAMKVGTYPMIMLGKLTGTAGETGGDLITINIDYFEFYKKGYFASNSVGEVSYPKLVPITVLHEVAHWGYMKGQNEGHSSDHFGREHHNHDPYKSPLNVELEKIFDAIAMLSAGHRLL